MRAQDSVRRGIRAAATRLPDLFRRGTRVVVGFSGGQDSTCLLHALAHLRLDLDIIAVHVDHSLRPDSAEAARRVTISGSAMGHAVEVVRLDVADYRRGLPGWSVQQAARSARYQALAAVAHQRQAAAVLVGHTADDQAETLLLNLLRGAGLAGLAGMPLDESVDLGRLGPAIALPVPYPLGPTPVRPTRMRLARPLLSVARASTASYCTEAGLPLVEDPSNQSRAFTRNRVRLDLLPALEQFNPAIRTVLARTADLVAEDNGVLDGLVDGLEASMAPASTADRVAYDLQLWRAQPRALQRRLLRRGLDRLLGGLEDVRAAPVEDALQLLQSGAPEQTYHLPHGVELAVFSATFVLRLHGRARPRTRPKSRDVEASRV